MTDRDEELRMHVAQALTRAHHPDAIRHLQAALRLLDDVHPPLRECPVCGHTGAPEQIVGHDCP